MYAEASLFKTSWLIIFGLLLLSPTYAEDRVSNTEQIILRNNVINVLNLQTTKREKNRQAAYSEIQALKLQVVSRIRSKQLIEARDTLDFHAPKGEWQLFFRFNLANAFIKEGQYDNAIDQLAEILKVESRIPELLLLQDKANFSLGLALLKKNQQQSAQTAFNNIRIHTSEANKLLLDIGQAWYQYGDLEKALIAWLALFNRPLVDHEVQRALFAVPVTLDKMGHSKQALVYYDLASERYNKQLLDLTARLTIVRDGEISQALHSLITSSVSRNGKALNSESPPLLESISTSYLFNLFSQRTFHQQVQSYREFHFYKSALNVKSKQLVHQQQSLKALRQQARAFGPELSTGEITKEITRLQKQHGEVSKKLAKMSSRKQAKKREHSLLLELDRIELRLSQFQKRLALPVGKNIKSLDELDKETIQIKHQRQEIKKILSKVDNAISTLKAQIQSLAITELEQQQLNLKQWQQRVRLAQARLADQLLNPELVNLMVPR